MGVISVVVTAKTEMPTMATDNQFRSEDVGRRGDEPRQAVGELV